MPRAVTRGRGKPGQQVGPLKEKTIHAALTKQRIHAIVGQVIDELQSRRAAGKGDYVKALADEIEEGGIAAWKALRDLLPRDDATPPGGTSFSFGNVFVAAAIEASRRASTEASPVIDVTGELVTTTEPDDPAAEVEW